MTYVAVGLALIVAFVAGGAYRQWVLVRREEKRIRTRRRQMFDNIVSDLESIQEFMDRKEREKEEGDARVH